MTGATERARRPERRLMGRFSREADGHLGARACRCVTSKRLVTPDIHMLRGAMTEQDFHAGVFANPMNVRKPHE